MRLVEEGYNAVAGVEAGDFWADRGNGAGAVGERGYGGMEGEGVLACLFIAFVSSWIGVFVDNCKQENRE